MRWQAIWGHICVAGGCYLLAWSIYLLPIGSPEPAVILTHPLFWGLFSIFGGVCANVHSRCRCIREEWPPPKKAAK